MPFLASLLLAGQAACPTPAVLPAPLAAWRRPRAITASAASGQRFPVLTVGEAYTATLAPAAGIRWVRAPAKAAAAGSHGGLLAFDVTTAGTYRVGLSGPGWIDVLEKGQAVRSSAHGHGPACSGIRKLVGFRLQPGRHVLQLAGLPEGSATVMVVRE